MLAALFKIKPRAWERDAGLPASTFVIRIYDFPRCRSDGAQIFSRGFARLRISNNLERDLLSLVEPVHASALDRADVHEHILGAVIRLDESVAFLAVEPLHGSLRHMARLSGTCLMGLHVSAASSFEIWRRSSVRRGGARRGQVIRPKLDWRNMGHYGLGCKRAIHEPARSPAQLARAVRKCS
jgi:hypothetical protein